MEVLIDVRDPAEFAAGHRPEALNLPLAGLDGALSCLTELAERQGVCFICKSGMRAGEARRRLLAVSPGLAERIRAEGGGAAAADSGAGAPAIPVMRQVLIAAGGLVLVFAGLSLALHPNWVWGALFVGGGLLFAGSTGICAMATLLERMPWNRPRKCGGSCNTCSGPQS